jgi:hypothetical protein
MTGDVMTDDTNDTIPAAAKRLEAKAQSRGWTTRLTRVHGQFNGKDIDSVALRMRRGEVRLAATWENGAFRTGLRSRPLARLNSRQIIALIEADDEPDMAAS